MWVEMKETVCGAGGVFAAGMRYDLEAADIKRLPKGSFVPSVAPYEDHKAANTPSNKQYKPGKKDKTK